MVSSGGGVLFLMCDKTADFNEIFKTASRFQQRLKRIAQRKFIPEQSLQAID
jgi:hypothetical protein